MTMKNFFFPQDYPGPAYSRFLLGVRLLFGILFISHGYEKLMDYEVLATVFPDPLGVGASLSLTLVIFAELFCAMAFIAGFLFRLSVLPMIFAMGVAFFSWHGGGMQEGELSLIYFVVFLMMLVAGPGRYSLDHLISILKEE